MNVGSLVNPRCAILIDDEILKLNGNALFEAIPIPLEWLIVTMVVDFGYVLILEMDLLVEENELPSGYLT
jgi:hypothetical protein